ncbi:hypothetical protein J7E38_21445 [Bacillus sp. ISL-35]|uniref:hypothetical protein n=1 Tax=Bacillus sp. ISL-35 TaxID=2819122 RepID=UPI001BE63E4C|nr:hypothetical protein [Bacillus sp. ISL-35]MBT2681537.1 hypothetical protein [Bacillus sp. ISL-35]MBT2705656.1 hypothetical protein [Chryseobacterium sp. ISL-80]
MHFRQLIITGFIASVALLVPDMAFAEKDSNAGKGSQAVAAQQAALLNKAENAGDAAKSSEKPAVKKQPVQKEVVQKPVQAKIPDKPVDTLKANGKATSLKKNEKAAQPQTPRASNPGNSNQAKHNQKHSNDQNKKGAVKSIHTKDQNVTETKRRSPGLEEMVERPEESAQTRSSVKKTAKTKVRKMPIAKKVENDSSKDENNSSQNDRYPKGDNLPNPPSRTKASGGPSSDRSSYGNSSTFLSDKWFIWDEAFHLNLMQPLISRVTVFQSQWVNAPPSPPPLEAPVFLPYTDAIATESR